MTALILGAARCRCELRATTDVMGKNSRLFAPQRRHRNAEKTLLLIGNWICRGRGLSEAVKSSPMTPFC